MNIEQFREHCLSVKGAEECFPFDEDVLVFKVAGKMFAYGSLAPRNGRYVFSLKCDPERTLELREHYADIGRGIHTASNLWISVAIQGDVPDSLIEELIRHSVDEVIKKLPKKKQTEYLTL